MLMSSASGCRKLLCLALFLVASLSSLAERGRDFVNYLIVLSSTSRRNEPHLPWFG